MSLALSARALLAGALAAAMAALVNFEIERPLDNDEAVELVESVLIPTNRITFLLRDYPRPSGNYNESLSLFLNRATLIGIDQTRPTAPEQDVRRIRWLRVALFGATGALLFACAAALFGNAWAAVGVALMATSAHLLLMNQFLIRNGLTPFWSLLALMVGAWGLAEDSDRARARRWLIWLPLAVICGIWTYTSFRAYALALYAAIAWMLWRERSPAWRHQTLAVSAGIALGTILLLTSLAGNVMIDRFFDRGSIVAVAGHDYLRNFGRTLLMVVQWQTPDGTFVSEGAHQSMRVALLSPVLALFFALGCWRSWRAEDVRLAIIPRCLLLFLPLAAVGGPNIRHPLVVMPLVLLITLSGGVFVAQLISRSPILWRRMAVAAASLLAVASAGLELYRVFVLYPQSQTHTWAREPQVFGFAARNAQVDGRTPIWIFHPRGRDVIRWWTLPFEIEPASLIRFETWESLQFAALVSAQPPKLILVPREMVVVSSVADTVIAPRRFDPWKDTPR